MVKISKEKDAVGLLSKISHIYIYIYIYIYIIYIYTVGIISRWRRMSTTYSNVYLGQRFEQMRRYERKQDPSCHYTEQDQETKTLVFWPYGKG